MRNISKWLGVGLFGATITAGAIVPATSEATSTAINNVIVTSTQGADVQTWCMVGCVDVDGGPIWAGGAGTVVNSPTQGGAIKALILTQTTGFNFDTSEHVANGTVTLCQGGSICTITLSVNGVNIPLALNNAINNFNNDPGGVFHQEAQNWAQVFDGGPGAVRVSIGYADSAHNGACSDVNAGNPGSVLGNCVPDNPWQGSPNTVFIGAAGGTVELGGCTRVLVAPTGAPCFDAGTILIQVNDTPVTQTPEPGSMFLLGAGLAGLVAWNRKRRK